MWGLLFSLCVFGVCHGQIPSLDVAHRYNHLVEQPLDAMPRTIKEAEQMGFSKVGGCEDNPMFKGVPYRRPKDFNVTILFDISGDIAGIQIWISISSIGSLLSGPFNREGDFQVLTLYFKESSLICNAETPVPQHGSYEVFLQLDESPLSSIGISLTESALDTGKWRKGPCVSGIGQHYWLIFEEFGGCDVSSPIFIVFDKRGNLFSIGYSLLYNKAPQQSVPILNTNLEKVFVLAAPKCFRSVFLFDYVYIFFSRKWIRSQCLF